MLPLQIEWLDYFFQYIPAVIITSIIVGPYCAFSENQVETSEKKKKKKSKYPDFEMDFGGKVKLSKS